MRRTCITGLMASVLAACTAGPDFHRPEPPEVASFTPAPLPPATTSAPIAGGEEQRFSIGRDIPRQWWDLFQSRELTSLVETALKANPTISAAEASLRQAQELVAAQRGLYYPTVQASYSASRQRTSASLSPAVSSNNTLYNLHTAQLSIGFIPDVFGGNRRAVESLQAQADLQRFQLYAAQTTVSSNVVAAAIQEASLRAQIAATHEIIAANTRSLEILRRMFAAGAIAGLDVAAQEAQLAQAQQALPPLEKQLGQTRNLLAALAGRMPSSELGEAFELDHLTLPRELPIGLPSGLVRQRPDVLAAEAALHSASAQIGVAVAAMVPQFTINAVKGGTAVEFGQMFSAGNPFWTISAGVTQTLFAGGSLLHRKRAAEAAFEQAQSLYRATVIGSFQNVADALYALQSDAEALKAAVASEQAARKTLDLVTKQLNIGQVNYLALTTALLAHQQTLIALAQARANRFADTAALFQALGGGWWNLYADASKRMSAPEP